MQPPSEEAPPTPASVLEAGDGARGFDTDTKLSATTAAAFYRAGFSFTVRYLSRSVPASTFDLTADEVEAILSAGLALMAVQHVLKPGWSPTEELGRNYGENAGTNAKAAGLPSNLTLWLDLEGVKQGTPSSDISAYCTQWCSKVVEAGYRAGIYVGETSGLSSDELDLLPVDLFWRSASKDIPYPAAGYCLVQAVSRQPSLGGVGYDDDLIQLGNTGALPTWYEPHHKPDPTDASPTTVARNRWFTFRRSTDPTKSPAKPEALPTNSSWSAVTRYLLVLLTSYAGGTRTGATVLTAIQHAYSSLSGLLNHIVHSPGIADDIFKSF